MVCRTFNKVNYAGCTFYYPEFKDFIRCEQFKRERRRFGFEMPEEVKCKKALPSSSYTKRDLTNKLTIESQMKATSLVELFISGINNAYPEVICAEMERGKYLKFQFQHFFSFDFMEIPIVVYKPTTVIGKKAAKKYMVCLDQTFIKKYKRE